MLADTLSAWFVISNLWSRVLPRKKGSSASYIAKERYNGPRQTNKPLHQYQESCWRWTQLFSSLFFFLFVLSPASSRALGRGWKSPKRFTSLCFGQGIENRKVFKRFYVLVFILKSSLKRLDFFFPYSGSGRQWRRGARHWTPSFPLWPSSYLAAS